MLFCSNCRGYWARLISTPRWPHVILQDKSILQYQGRYPFPHDWADSQTGPCLPPILISQCGVPLCFVPDSDSLGSPLRDDCWAIRLAPDVSASLPKSNCTVALWWPHCLPSCLKCFLYFPSGTAMYFFCPTLHECPIGTLKERWLVLRTHEFQGLIVWPSQTQIPYTKPFSFLESQHYPAVTWVLTIIPDGGSRHVSHLTVDIRCWVPGSMKRKWTLILGRKTCLMCLYEYMCIDWFVYAHMCLKGYIYGEEK